MRLLFIRACLGTRLLPQSYQYPNLSEGADRIGGQVRGDKECPISGVSKSGRVWRTVPESDARRKMPESDARRKVPESDARWKVPESDARRKVPESDARRKVPESDARSMT